MRRNGLVAVAAVAAAALLTGCGDTGEETAGSGSSSPAAAKGDAKREASAEAKDVKITRSGVEDHEVWGRAFVTHYEITNHGKGAANYFVQLEFLDGDGDVLGATGVTADKLGPGKTNKGDTAPMESEIKNGKMSDIKRVRVSTVERTDPV